MTNGCGMWVRMMGFLFATATGLVLSVSGVKPLAHATAVQKDAPSVRVKQVKDPLLPRGVDDVDTGFTFCLGCHNEKSPIDVKDNEFASRFKSNEFVLLTEGRTWKQQDPHSAASKVLGSPLGLQMAGILGYDVTKAVQCLTCHSIDKDPVAPVPNKAHDILTRFDSSEGVTCNACHGLRKPWQKEHSADKVASHGGRTIPWRTFSPEKKEELGMRNLRDPVVKAKLCASCHVGNPAEGKIISHEIYAAGHPPLPPFELATFLECQPKHWGYPLNPALKFFTDTGFQEYAGEEFAKAHANWRWELYRFHSEEQEISLVRSLAAGAVASLLAEMRMIALEAAHVVKGQGGGVDFARFDCYACHHDLKSPSDRQARGYGGPPGRPPIKAWVAALPGVVVDHAAGLKNFADLAKEFHPKWEAVQKASLARPFGKPDELEKSASELAAWCEEFLKKLQDDADPIYTKMESARLLAAIGEAATSKLWTADPEATMHLTWAYVTLRRHSMIDIPPDKLDALKKTIPIQVRAEPFTTDGLTPRIVGDTLRQRLD
ncbi:MAG TPA: multiheme c-type cytochrome, partial [Gemmata sp.]|nr:multiheme c-type cytochrome [Gemmata sp.]